MKKRYFAADTPEDTVRILQDKSKNWFQGVMETDYIDKIKRSWNAYHGNYYDKAHKLSYGGEQEELVNLAVNHYRNLARHIHVMVTGTRPSFRCRAINTDRKSLIQATLGNGLLEYYMREMKLEKILKDAVEYAIVLGSSYIKLEWNSTKGKIHDYIEPSPEDAFSEDEEGNLLDEDGELLEPFPIYDGDIDFSLLSPFDVVFDSTKEYFSQNDWVLCRTFVNKYDLAAKYPEFSEKLLELDTKENVDKRSKRVLSAHTEETDDVPVYEFFHKRTESMPNGRYLLYASNEIILNDTVMPYRELPIYRITPAEILGTPYGYTDMFDLLPLQELLNSLYSTAATNINAFGVQNILNPRGNDVTIEQVSEGMNFIEYNSQFGEPKSLDLVKTSPEVYKMMEILERTMETLSGVNAVARGNPEAQSQLRSGNALALIQSQALQFVSGLQQSYIQLLEDVGTGVINLLKDFASSPRVAAITGINNSTEMKEFKSDDIKDINRVAVDVGNALMSTTAGRAQVAENLLQMNLIDSVDKYLMVLNSGNLDVLTEGKMDEMMTIRGENEALINGEEVIAIFSDKHAMHIQEHQAVLANYRRRMEPDLVERTLAHIQEHINLLQTTDPNILMMLGQQPLQPPQAPQDPNQAPPQQMPEEALGTGQQMVPPEQTGGLPNPASPPAPFEDLPTDPQQLMAQNVKG